MMKTSRSIAAALLFAVAAACPMIAWAAAQDQPAATFPRLGVTAGRSMVLTADFDVTRIAVTNPAVADATVVSPREVLIDGKTPGTVSLILWGADRRAQYDVVVDPGITPLQQQLRDLFPGEDINVTTNDEETTLFGHVSSNTVMLRAGEIATKSSAKTKIINLLQVPGGIESQEVMLQVRFAEVNRSALSNLGFGLFTSPTGLLSTVGRVTTEQFPSPGFDQLVSTQAGTGFGAPVTSSSGTFTFSDFLNLFLYSEKYNIGGMLKALQTKGLLQSLAEPNLIGTTARRRVSSRAARFPSRSCRAAPHRPSRSHTRNTAFASPSRRRLPATRFGCTSSPRSARSTSPTGSR